MCFKHAIINRNERKKRIMENYQKAAVVIVIMSYSKKNIGKYCKNERL